MAHRNCFRKPQTVEHTGDYIRQKKSRTMYSASVNLANQPVPGVYNKKSSLGKSNGTYVGDIKMNDQKCLLGATSYDSLYLITQGKSSVDPLPTILPYSNLGQADMFKASLTIFDTSGLTIIDASAGSALSNTFVYPPTQDNTGYPPADAPNLVVDPSGNVFGRGALTGAESGRGICYLKDQLAYQKHQIVLTGNQALAKLSYGKPGKLVSEGYYTRPFKFTCNLQETINSYPEQPLYETIQYRDFCGNYVPLRSKDQI